MVEETPKDQITLFHKIVRGEIKSEKVYEDDDVYAFKDINPVAPFHCLLIPKKLNGLTSLLNAKKEHSDILGKLMLAASKIAEEQKLEKGFRLVINNGEDSGQSVNYIHLHIIAGRSLKWPPG